MDTSRRLLSWSELALIVLLVFPIFVLVGGPIWNHPFDIDGAVYWSYAPIPVLVALFLLRRRALSWAGFMVSAILALCMKYGLTASIAFALWAWAGPPSHPVRSAGATARSAPSAIRPVDPDAVDVALDTADPNHPVVVPPQARELVFHARDHSLHTLVGKTNAGATAFNVPVIPGRGSPPVALRRARGPIRLSCGVHPDERFAPLLFGR